MSGISVDSIALLNAMSASGAGGGTMGADPAGAARALAGVDIPPELRSDNVPEDEKMRLAVQQFESMLVRMMIKEMRKTVQESGLLSKTMGHKMFEGLMDDQLAQNIGGGMGLGLSEALMRQLSRPTGETEES